jgi:hypothetical protein
MHYKTTTRLFKGIYQYKIVLVCPGSGWFRNGLEEALEQLKRVDLADSRSNATSWRASFIKTQEQLDYAFKLQSQLSKLKDIDIRVESPWISVYTNKKSDVDKLANLDKDQVKYISQPVPNTSLSADTIIMPKMNYEYRVTLGKTNQENLAFVSWAETNKKVKLTKSCVKDLGKARSWGGTHFYITGDNNLLLAKMHLGGSIAKVERIIKA